jgi:tetratricopeptide (TPR) repeat protein
MSDLRRRLLVGLLLVVSIVGLRGSVVAQDHAHVALGRVEFPVSCSADARAEFERAMALLHSFWWAEAGRAFTAVTAADPNCAMAHWGRAMVARSNWFAGPPSVAAVAAGLAAAERGLEIGGRTERERGYLEAVATLFRGSAAGDNRTAALAYEEAMRDLHETYPADPEAAMFYALSVSANATAGDKSFERQRRAGAILEPLFAEHPDHPGLAHYIIHTYDAPPIAHLGVEAARRYGAIAPSVPHAQHMPSHIFTRLGMWDESIEANDASADAARAYEESQGMTAVSFDRAHAWDYLVYAYLQQGRDREAARLAADVAAATAEPSIATGYAFAAIPARYALERGRWADAAELTVRAAPGFPAGEAITHFARGIGAARMGNTRSAGESVAALTVIRDTLRTRGDAYWAEAVEAQRLAVSAWIAYGGGDVGGALDLVEQAATLEERIDKHPVTPGPVLPARELQGDMLMEIGRPGEALDAYELALVTEPRRTRSLHGAARAAAAAGDDQHARMRYSDLLDVMARADAERPELLEARAYTGG